MLREFWNFHNDIAIPLEGIARRHYGDISRPVTKIYDADAIERGSFVEVMMALLREKSDMENSCDDIEDFISECKEFVEVNGNAIPKEEAQRLFDKFKEMYKE